MPYQPTYSYIPPLDWHVLTPFYDFSCRLIGLGTKFREEILQLIKIEDGQTIADVGCGTGVFLSVVQKRFPSSVLIGIDPDKKALAIATKRLNPETERLKLKEGYGEALPLEDSSVDICFSTLAFHHMPSDIKKKAALELYRVLKQGGKSVITDFCQTNSWFRRKLLFWEKAEYIKGNFDGLIPKYLREAGFVNLREVKKRKFSLITTLVGKK